MNHFLSIWKTLQTKNICPLINTPGNDKNLKTTQLPFATRGPRMPDYTHTHTQANWDQNPLPYLGQLVSAPRLVSHLRAKEGCSALQKLRRKKKKRERKSKPFRGLSLSTQQRQSLKQAHCSWCGGTFQSTTQHEVVLSLGDNDSMCCYAAMLDLSIISSMMSPGMLSNFKHYPSGFIIAKYGPAV